jgi:hypothetical protein
VRRVPDPVEYVETTTDDIIERIRSVGGQLVMMDTDLADFYGVARSELRAMVRRNKDIFAVEFVVPIRLDGRRKRSLAFTEHGVIVAASMLDDPGIEAVSIHLVRAFVKKREEHASRAELARRIVVLDEAVMALDARIRENFVEIYEALGVSVKTAAPGSSSHRRLH